MKNIIIIIILAIMCCMSSVIGAILGYIISKRKYNNLSGTYYFTAGIMNSIVCFEMIPETISSIGIFRTILFLLLGVIIIILFESKNKLRTITVAPYVMIIAMASHNILEGIVIGVSFLFSINVGIKVFLAMFLHDIPESMAVFIVDNEETKKAFYYSIIVGLVTVLGIIFGMLIGKIFENISGYIMAMASGAMLYVISYTLIPKSFEDKMDKKQCIMYIIGIVLGIIIKNI